jgi:hypothetical protein
MHVALMQCFILYVYLVLWDIDMNALKLSHGFHTHRYLYPCFKNHYIWRVVDFDIELYKWCTCIQWNLHKLDCVVNGKEMVGNEKSHDIQ